MSATTVWICLLSFPHHFCRSCTIFFCHAYMVMFVFYSVRHVWAFGHALPFFVPPWNGYCLDKGLCPYSPLGSYSYHFSSFPWAYWLCWPIGLIASFLGRPQPTCHIFTSYSSPEPASYYSCHVGPLSLLHFFLDFLRPLTLSLPLILPMGLLIVIPAMLAHWGLLSLFLGFLDSFTSSLPLILPMSLLAVIPTMLAHWVY